MPIESYMNKFSIKIEDVLRESDIDRDSIRIKVSSKFITIGSSDDNSSNVVIGISRIFSMIEFIFPTRAMVYVELEVASPHLYINIANAKPTVMHIYGNAYGIYYSNCTIFSISIFGYVSSLTMSAVKTVTLTCSYVKGLTIINNSAIECYQSIITKAMLCLSLDGSMEVNCSNIDIRGRRNQVFKHDIVVKPSKVFFKNNLVSLVKYTPSNIIDYVLLRTI